MRGVVFRVVCEDCGQIGKDHRTKGAAKAGANAHQRRHRADEDFEANHLALYEQFPSLRWGEQEWKAVLEIRGDIIDAIARDIVRLNESERRSLF